MSWKLLHLGPEGEAVTVGDANVWTKPWKTQGEAPVLAKHPAHPEQEHRLCRYFIESNGKAHEFAAGEVSPGVWLFFVPAAAEYSVLFHIVAYALAVAGCFILLRGFEHSLGYVALGAVLVAIAMGAERYARRQ